MRFSIAYYLLLLYTLVMLKPLLPLVCDAWGHAFAEARHIASVHAKYGEHHLEKQLAAEQDNSTKNEAGIKTFDAAPAHYPATQTEAAIKHTPAKKQYIPFLQGSLSSTPSCIIVPPPEFL